MTSKERPSSATSSSDRWSPCESLQKMQISSKTLKDRLAALTKRTGYPIVQENGQRKYGPPLDWQGDEPPRGCEVFIGKLPRDMMEDEIIPLFEAVGKLYRFRLMLDFSGTNRGFAFAKFTNRESAKKAVAELDNYEIRHGRHIGVVISVDNCRLYLGRIPRNKTCDEVKEEISKLTEGVVRVILYSNAEDKTKNRGFAFVEYQSHQAATMARRKLIPGQVTMWGVTVEVDWAEPEQEPDEEVLSKVKNLYVRNLMAITTELRIKEFFESVTGEGTIEHVKKMKDYAFVHFTQREHAILALNKTNGLSLDGATLEVVWAKPVDRNLKRIKSVQMASQNLPVLANLSHGVLTTGGPMLLAPSAPSMPGIIPPLHLPMPVPVSNVPPNTPTPIGAAPNASAYAGFPFIDPTAGGFSPSSPWVRLPNIRNRCAAGMRSAGFQTSVSNAMRRTHRKFSEQSVIEDVLNGSSALTGIVSSNNGMLILPTPTFAPLTAVHLPLNAFRSEQPVCTSTTTTTTATTAPNVLHIKGYWQLLEDYCKQNSWSPPQYQQTVITTKDRGGRDVPMYVFKVTIPELVSHYGHFERCKSSNSIEEAREDAAQFVLLQLGFPFHQLAAVTV